MLRRDSRAAIYAVSLMTALVGLLDLITAVTPALPDALEDLTTVFPLEVRTGAHVFAGFSSFLLLTLALNLLRRKQLAWLLICLLLGGSIMLHLLRGVQPAIVGLSAALLGLLLWMRPAFTAQSDPPSIRQGLRAFAFALVFTLAYGSLGFYLLDRHFSVNFDGREAITQTLAMFFTEDNAGLTPRTRFGATFADSIALLGLATTAYALVMLLRPVLRPLGPTAPQQAQARTIVAQHGRASLAAFCLFPDKTLFFSPSFESLIAFAAKGRGAIALGDPIGPASDRSEAIAAFLAHCHRNDWEPAFYQVLPDDIDLYISLGLRAIKIGEEGIVDLTSLSLKGKAAAGFRTPLNKLRKLGHAIEFHTPPVAESLIDALAPVSDEWLRKMEGAEKRFSLGWFDRDYLRASDLAVVRTPEGRISAFANLVSGVRPGEVMVDLMRNRAELEPGTMDALFVALFQHYQEQGYSRFSLGLSALSGLDGDVQAPRLARSLERLSRHLDRFYGFKGLHAYKAKFHPTWEPRYLVFPRLQALPEVVLALVRADSGDRLLDYVRSS